jgi:hypothetical protein
LKGALASEKEGFIVTQKRVIGIQAKFKAVQANV